MRDTEKEVDPVGGTGGTEDGGVEARSGRVRLGRGQTENVPEGLKRQTDTRTQFTQKPKMMVPECDHSVGDDFSVLVNITKRLPLPFVD